MKELRSHFTAVRIEDSEIWQNFILSRPEANFLQSHLWGDFQQRLGKTVHRTGFYLDQKLVGVMLSVVENAKRARYITVAGGPIIDWSNSELVSTWITEIRKIAQESKAVFVRVRPQLIEDQSSTEIFNKLGFIKSPMHLTADLTHQLDITPSAETLLADMRKTTRNEIKKAQKLKIQIQESINSADIDEFYKVQLQTAQFHKFIPFSHQFLQEQFNTFAEAGNAILYKALFEEKLLALAIVIFYGQEAVYHYGASTRYGREYPGAYLIQWQAINEAKKRGLKRYNFWGVAPEGHKDHRFYGVSVFKRGFGGTDFEYLHAHDLVINPIRYQLNYIIESLRKKKRSL